MGGGSYREKESREDITRSNNKRGNQDGPRRKEASKQAPPEEAQVTQTHVFLPHRTHMRAHGPLPITNGYEEGR